MKPARKSTSSRQPLYAKTAIAQKQLGLDDDVFRDLLENRYGVRSRTKMSEHELVDLLEYFGTLGFRPRARKTGKAASGEHRKIRALWLSLYNLGVVADPSEDALGAFARRVTGGKVHGGVERLAWVSGENAQKVIEALKDWAARDGGVNWEPYASTTGIFYNDRARVLEAQWHILAERKIVLIGDRRALDRWGCKALGVGADAHILSFSHEQQDSLIRQLGEMIRRSRPEAS